MQKALLIILILGAALALSCWRSGADQTANSQVDTTVNIAEITDANQALATGNQLFENNETERAIEAYLKATALDPDLAEAWFQLGIAYSLVEKEQELRAESDTEEPGRPNSEKAFRKAIEAYRKVLENNPEDHVAYYNMGRAYNKLNEDQEAAKALRQAVKINPDDSEYQTELGAILIKLAEYREAIPPLKKALELDPENVRASELLEDAQAGRSRIDYSTRKANSNTNSKGSTNANTDSNTNVSSDMPPPPIVKPTPRAATPQPRATPKPTERPASES